MRTLLFACALSLTCLGFAATPKAEAGPFTYYVGPSYYAPAPTVTYGYYPAPMYQPYTSYYSPYTSYYSPYTSYSSPYTSWGTPYTSYYYSAPSYYYAPRYYRGWR